MHCFPVNDQVIKKVALYLAYYSSALGFYKCDIISLELHHWTKEKEINDVYPFSKFNKQTRVISYTDDEYKKVIAPMKSDWDKLETDVLFELCERFSLRFIVIADRFNYELAEQEAKRDCIALPKSKLRKRD